MPIERDKERRIIEDRPPWFGSWTPIYALVLGFLGFLVLLFHLFTRHYR